MVIGQTKELLAVETRRRSWVGYVTMGAASILAAAVVIAVAVTNEAAAQTPASDLKRPQAPRRAQVLDHAHHAKTGDRRRPARAAG